MVKHPVSGLEYGLHALEPAAVAEAVGGHVQNPHDVGLMTEAQDRAAPRLPCALQERHHPVEAVLSCMGGRRGRSRDSGAWEGGANWVNQGASIAPTRPSPPPAFHRATAAPAC